MRRYREYWYVALALVPSGIVGCAEELGPERFVTTEVTGRVVVGGQPLRKGWVEFLPVEGTVGNPRSASIGADGRFTADRVAVGWNRIGIVGAALTPELTGLFHPFGSPIRRKISPTTGPIELNLLTEAIAARRTSAPGFRDKDRPDRSR